MPRDIRNDRARVSVLIVTWNSGGDIQDCLDSVFAHSGDVPLEVIVVDNGSTDRTAEIVRSYKVGVRFVEAGANLGFPRGINLALDLSGGEYVMLLNPDARFETDVLSTLWRFLGAHPTAGAVGPKIVEPDGRTVLFAARRFPSATAALCTELGLRRLLPRAAWAGRGGSVVDPAREKPVVVPCLSGAAVLLSRTTLDRVGKLNDEMPMYLDDLDLCARLGRLGAPLYYVPAAVVRHHGARSAAASPFRRLLIAAEFGHAPWMYLRKFRGGGAARAFALAIAVGSLYRWLLARLALLVPVRTSPALRQEAERQRARASSLLDWARRSRTDFQRHFRAQFASDDVWEQLRVMVLAEDAPPVRASSKGHEWSA